MVFTNPQSRTPSAGYGWCRLFALPGAFFLFLSLYGSYRQSIGHSPIDAMNWIGDVAFAGIFVLMFTLRLIFWSRSPPALQSALRTAFTAFFGATVILSRWRWWSPSSARAVEARTPSPSSSAASPPWPPFARSAR